MYGSFVAKIMKRWAVLERSRGITGGGSLEVSLPTGTPQYAECRPVL